MNENDFWYVIYTRPRWEKKIAAILDQKGIENYCPLNKVERKWSDRKKTILEPLFKGYIFIKIEETKKWDIKQIDGIVNYVYWLGKPARVRQSEINNIKFFLKEFTSVDSSAPYGTAHMQHTSKGDWFRRVTQRRVCCCY